jgi:PhnB protein
MTKEGKIMQIRPYLTFKGECQEAIELYKRAFKIEKAEIMRF